MPLFKSFATPLDLIDETSKLGGIYRTFDRKRHKRPVFLCWQHLVWSVIEIGGKEEGAELEGEPVIAFSGNIKRISKEIKNPLVFRLAGF